MKIVKGFRGKKRWEAGLEGSVSSLVDCCELMSVPAAEIL
jgi:hypothetical protein